MEERKEDDGWWWLGDDGEVGRGGVEIMLTCLGCKGRKIGERDDVNMSRMQLLGVQIFYDKGIGNFGYQNTIRKLVCCEQNM